MLGAFQRTEALDKSGRDLLNKRLLGLVLIDITVAALAQAHFRLACPKGASIVGAVLRIDRGGLRTASACSASSGTAGNASAAVFGAMASSATGLRLQHHR